jgi:glutaminyl-peptide cyclotransferase
MRICLRYLVPHAVLLSLLLSSCTSCSQSGGSQTADPLLPPYPQFDRQTAFAFLETQCEFGPRVPGTQPHQECLNWLIQELARFGGTVIPQRFSASTPFGGPFDFTNVIAYFPGNAPGGPVLLGAHWDTRPEADEDPDPALRKQPVLGANDGASGVAVLLEIARQAHDRPERRSFIVALFDAEDSGKSNAAQFPLDGWCIGSAYLAQNLPEEIPTPEAAIIVDMVGRGSAHNSRVGNPRGAKDYMELQTEGYSLNSAPELVDEIWSIAEQAGHTAFVRTKRGYVTDDHLPFILQGISAVDIIDFPPEWHTTDDIPQYCSPNSLYQVGDTLLRYLYGVRQH